MNDSVPTGLYAYLPQERVIFGRPAAEALADEAARLGAARVLIVAPRTLARETTAIEEVARALGARHAAIFDGCRQHTPRATVIAAAEAARAADADLIATVGGGTAIDTVKVVQVALAHDVRDVDGLDGLHITMGADGRRVTPEIAPSPVRQIIAPTTLSGAEFSNLGAATNPRTGLKEPFTGPDICGRSVILDPRLTRHTPDWLWLSTGVRSVDHAVETLCAIDANAYCDGLALHALRCLADGLRRTRAAPDDLAARLQCQQGVWLAASSIARVNYGASHGIGHVLGALADVPHGHTSCILLPHVMRYNAEATAAKQAMIHDALGGAGTDAADAVARLIADLGQPATLRDAGVERDMLPRIADGAMANFWVRTNPRPIESPDQVMTILEAAW